MVKTLKQWMKELGYEWAKDEQLVKGLMDEGEARSMLGLLAATGDIRKCS